jgi:hypothetical protein
VDKIVNLLKPPFYVMIFIRLLGGIKSFKALYVLYKIAPHWE